MRTKEEINEMIRRGEKFVKNNPRTIFGGDNSKHLELMKKIFHDYQSGKSMDEMYDMIDYLEDENSTCAMDVLDWLNGDNDCEPYSKGDADR